MPKRKKRWNEYSCPKCGGYIYRQGILGAKPYKCVRCGGKFSIEDINNEWMKKHQEVIEK